MPKWALAALIGLVLVVVGFMLFISFTTVVKPGYVGIKVSLYGSSKGVDDDVVGVGRHFLWFGQDIYRFPTFQQTKVWTKDVDEGSPHDDSFTFQSKKGMSINADVAVAYTIDATKVALLFQKYRKGVDEITNAHVRNVVRDALVDVASVRLIDEIYGEGKIPMLSEALKKASAVLDPIGIRMDYISFINDLRLPESTVKSINAKIESTQKAEQLENELRATIAEAKKAKAKAEGEATTAAIAAKAEADVMLTRAKAEAEATLLAATAEAKANKMISDSLTDKLLQYQRNDKWNGAPPMYMGNDGPIPMLDVRQ